jgi:hypothetical protein
MDERGVGVLERVGVQLVVGGIVHGHARQR